MQIFNVNEIETHSRGRKAGEHYLKPMDMHTFLWEHNLLIIQKENPWILDVGIVENPYLRESLGRANFKKQRMELSSIVMEGTVENRKKIFVKTICHFIAFNEFGVAKGRDYDDLVKRYLKNITSEKKPFNRPKSAVSVH